MISLIRITGILLFFILPLAVLAAAHDRLLPIVDAHSQMDQEITVEEIIRLMDEAGVVRTILAPRSKITPDQFLDLVSRYPDRIVPSVRTKGKHYLEGKTGNFERFLNNQIKSQKYGAMAEVLIWHAEKYHHTQKRPIAPQVIVPLDSPRVKTALEKSVENRWPFIAHIEFAAIGPERELFMSGFEAMLDSHQDHPFVLIHMGELEAEDAKRLIKKHRNIYFITAMCNPIALKNTAEPLVNLFKGNTLDPGWKALFLSHPDRFILGFDNVWARHWKKIYVPQVRLWRKALGELPEDIAHRIAHENAERLWNLPTP
jgi:predicted TIM-barrel fold metal-dependent hydrolase